MNLIQKIRDVRKWRRASSFYDALIPERSKCFDVGANIGDKSVVFSKLGHAVYAFEPQSECQPSLSNRLAGFPNATICKLGLGSEAGSAELQLCNLNEVSTLSKPFIKFYDRYEYLEWNKTESIKIETLDQQIQKFGMPSFVKIDVEGYELEVLRGLSSAVDVIEFEFNGPFKPEALECVNRISEIGEYQFNYSVYEQFKFELEAPIHSKEFIKTISKLPDSILTGDIYAIKS
jgi:FkbM family methyltransferase